MEWIIGLIVIWVIWRLLTGTARREATLKDSISRAYVASSRLNQNWIDTPIYWEAAERFAQDRGARISYDGSPSANFDMMIDGVKVSVTLLRNGMNGTTQVSARKKEDVIKEGEEFINSFINKHQN